MTGGVLVDLYDYVRHRTTSLFGALDVLSGKIIGQTQRKHRHQEFPRFLETMARRLPPTGSGQPSLHRQPPEPDVGR